MVVLEFLQAIVRSQGGELTYGHEDDLLALIQGGAKCANRWVLTPVAATISALELGEALDSTVYSLTGVWHSSFGRAEHVEEVLGKVRDIVRLIQNTQRTAYIECLRCSDNIEIEWQGKVLVATAQIETTIRRT